MKTISYCEYQSETSIGRFTNKLIEINVIPKNLFVKAAIYAARSVRHLQTKENKIICLKAIKTAEKYLRGEATEEECRNVDFTQAIGVAHAPSRAALLCVAAAAVSNDNINKNIAVAYAVMNTIICSASTAILHSGNMKRKYVMDFFREALPWNQICAAQVATAINQQENCQLIQQLSENQTIIDYATVILGMENLKEEFEFSIKDYLEKSSNENNIIF